MSNYVQTQINRIRERTFFQLKSSCCKKRQKQGKRKTFIFLLLFSPPISIKNSVSHEPAVFLKPA
jgi:hypothetical protein